MNWTIVTSIFGGYDELQTPLVSQDANLLCFTDQPFECEGWEVIQVDPAHNDPRRASRYVKILTHLYVKGPTIHIDASMVLKGDLVSLAEKCGEMAIPRHTHRSCVYDEIKACIRRKKDDPATLDAQLQRYLNAGMPRGYGLWENGLIVRWPSVEVEDFCWAWWEEYSKGSCRDQVALAFASWERGYRPSFIDLSLWKNDVCEVRQKNGKVDHKGVSNLSGFSTHR